MKLKTVYTKLLKIPQDDDQELTEFISLNGQGISKAYEKYSKVPLDKYSLTPMRIILYAIRFALSNAKAFKVWIWMELLKDAENRKK